MESPGSWNLTTASLAVYNLKRPFNAWAFLVVQGLVRDLPGDRDTFAEFVREEVANEITGPSAACRVAGRLSASGIGLTTGHIPDPWGQLAAHRLSLIEPWIGRQDAARYLKGVQKPSDPSGGDT